MNKDTTYRFLASGFILEGSEGKPQFPPRVADQALKRALQHHKRETAHVLYDPFCGNGIALAAQLVLHRQRIVGLIGSDIDPTSVELSRMNVELCTEKAARERQQQVITHPELARGQQTAGRLGEFADMLRDRGCTDLPWSQFFVHNVLEPTEAVERDTVSMLITDPPYGRQAPFVSKGEQVQDDEALLSLYPQTLEALRPLMQDGGVAVIIAHRRERLEEVLRATPGYAYKETKRTTGGIGGRNFRNLYVMTAV